MASASAHRVVEVPGDRLARWVRGFGDRHGIPSVRVDGAMVTLTAPDDALAVLQRPFGGDVPARGVDVPVDDGSVAAAWLEDLTTQARLGRNAAILLVRRGGYAVGLLADGQLAAHKVGTRYVQSRTAAGGWSQQRFARRRDGQAKALVGTTQDALVRLMSSHTPVSLIVGGDRSLAAEVLTDPRLHRLAKLPHRGLWDIADPRLATLTTAADRGARVTIRLNDLA